MVKPKYSQEKGAAIASNSIILSSTNKKYTGGNRDVRQDNEMFFSTNMPGRKLIEFCGLVNMNIQNASLYVKLNEPRKVLSIVLPLRIKLENILYTQPRLLSAKKFLLEILKLLNTSHYVIALANKQDHVNASAALEAALASHQLEPSHIYGMFSVIKTACQMGVFAEVVCLLQKMRNRGEQGAVLLADLWDYDWFTFELVSYAFSQMGKKDLARDLYIWLSTTLDSLVSDGIDDNDDDDNSNSGIIPSQRDFLRQSSAFRFSLGQLYYQFYHDEKHAVKIWSDLLADSTSSPGANLAARELAQLYYTKAVYGDDDDGADNNNVSEQISKHSRSHSCEVQPVQKTWIRELDNIIARMEPYSTGVDVIEGVPVRRKKVATQQRDIPEKIKVVRDVSQVLTLPNIHYMLSASPYRWLFLQ